MGGALDVRPERAEIKTENASLRNDQTNKERKLLNIKKTERDRMKEAQR